MILDDQEYKRYVHSRANLAFCCGVLYGQLFHIKSLIDQGELTPKNVAITNAIAESLETVAPIFDEEFYPRPEPKPPKPPAPPKNLE